MRGRSFFHDEIKCASCGYTMDSSIHHEGNDVVPSPGDVALCFRCATIHVFNADGVPEIPSKEKLAEAQADQEVQKAINRLKDFWKRAPH